MAAKKQIAIDFGRPMRPKEVLDYLSLRSDRTLARRRADGTFRRGIHYQSHSPSQNYFYYSRVIENYRLNLHDPGAHERWIYNELLQGK